MAYLSVLVAERNKLHGGGAVCVAGLNEPEALG
jgi:hypothetical protein